MVTHLCSAWVQFCTTIAELSSRDRDHGAHKAENICCLVLHRKVARPLPHSTLRLDPRWGLPTAEGQCWWLLRGLSDPLPRHLPQEAGLLINERASGPCWPVTLGRPCELRALRYVWVQPGVRTPGFHVPFLPSQRPNFHARHSVRLWCYIVNFKPTQLNFIFDFQQYQSCHRFCFLDLPWERSLHSDCDLCRELKNLSSLLLSVDVPCTQLHNAVFAVSVFAMVKDSSLLDFQSTHFSGYLP